ncbi:MAG: hypothetical protein ACRD22_11200, partial [Terriglobia bacterium]
MNHAGHSVTSSIDVGHAVRQHTRRETTVNHNAAGFYPSGRLLTLNRIRGIHCGLVQVRQIHSPDLDALIGLQIELGAG